jgi:O-acetylserine/cysteine efflux transporter
MRPLDLLTAVFVAFVWGLNFVVIKLGLSELPPLLFSALRFTVAALPWVFLVGRPQAPWRIILGIGLFLGLLKFSALFIGMDLGMPAGLASLVLQAQAFFTVLFAAVWLKERPRPRHLIGMAVAFAGLALIALDFGAAPRDLTGLALVVLAAALWGIANLFMKEARGANALNLIVWVSLVPPLPLLLVSVALEGPETVSAALLGLDWTGIGAVLYIGLVATIVGFGLWGRLLSRYPAAVVAPFSLLVPIFGMSAGALLLGEPLGLLRIAAAMLVLAGLAIVALPWGPLSAATVERPETPQGSRAS